MSEERTIRFLQDDIYQLIDIKNEEVLTQGTLTDINAYLDLEEKGLL